MSLFNNKQLSMLLNQYLLSSNQNFVEKA